MKVAHIVCTFPPYKGGMGYSAYHFARITARLGYNTTVFTPNYSKNDFKKDKDEISEKFKIVRLKPLIKYGNAALLPQLLWKLKKFDIIHLHYPFFGGAEAVWLASFFWAKKKKFIIHYHMDVITQSCFLKLLSWPAKLMRNSLFKRADFVTCASLDYIKHSSINYLYEKYKNKFFEVSFGVDINKFKPTENISRERNLALAATAERFNILFVGGLDKAHYFKGLEVLLKAFSQLSIDNCQLLVVGGGDLRSDYEKQAEKLGIKKTVEFAGSVNNEQLVEYYQKADVVVLPSINQGEAFGLVLLEAMACAKPVIASNLPGVRSVFKNGEHGFLVKPGNVDDLVDKLKIVLQDKALAEKMGQAGRKLVEDKYTWGKVGKRLDLIYHFVKYMPK